MKPILRFLLLFSMLIFCPIQGQSAMKHDGSHKQKSLKQSENSKLENQTFKEKWRAGKNRLKGRIQQFKRNIQMAFPRGKLLTTLVFLVLSVVFFAVAGLTTLAAIFNILGSVAVIVSLVFFIFWVMEKSNQAKVPAN